ncbi:hypothetical protein C8F01DRAFT_1077068 [Mycena amicta]|nr:hypothetical protein C8F01DRAFT_1077068 [Mycena amicta]
MRFWLSAILPAVVLANTEIINFAAPAADASRLLQTRDWPLLKPRTTTNWTITPALLGTPLVEVCIETNDPCPHERWFVLDLPDRGAKKYTLRLSYAAWSPTDFAITIFDPVDASIALSFAPKGASGPPTRRKYARIRAVDTGVLTPPFKPHASRIIDLFYRVYFPGFYATPPQPPDTRTMEFVLTLEPLLLGVLPASLAPLVAFSIVLLVIVARTLLPRVLAGLEGLAAEARRELGEELKLKEE